MAPRSKIEKLPQAVRKSIDQRLFESNFGDYVAIADELYAAGHRISKSAVHRYGKELEKRIQLGRAKDQLMAAGVSAELAAELTGDATLIVVIDRRNGRSRLMSLAARAPDVIEYIKQMGKA